jgi:hypothetical protein
MKQMDYEISMHNLPISSAILKNLCQVKQETHMNKKRLDIKPRKIDVLSLSIGYSWKQLDHKK